MRVFISYNHADKEFVKLLTSSLEKKGIDYFLDEKNISYGDSIKGTIHSAFDTVTHLVVVISPGSDQSHWVSYEIGVAIGRGIKVIPILAHPAMKLPPFINDIKYFRTIDEFDDFFHKQSLNTLQLDVDIDLLHCADLHENGLGPKGHLGFRKFTKNDMSDLEDMKWEPAITLKVTNRTGRTIVLKPPMINFKTSQQINGASLDAVGFMGVENQEIVSGGTHKYLIFSSVCKDVIRGFLNKNIKYISIESVDGFKYYVLPELLEEHREYAEQFFSK